MQELEKILGEIEQYRMAASDSGNFNVSEAYEKSINIIRKHMNDDWIPVEKQIPKKPHKNYEKFSGLWCKCGWYLGKKTCLDIKYCPNCGQAIDENLEGMRDE